MDIENKSENEAKAKRSLVFAITVNIVLLVFFKYFGFLVESTNTLFGISIPYRELALPIGISFYTFQEISYIVDVYRCSLLLDFRRKQCLQIRWERFLKKSHRHQQVT